VVDATYDFNLSIDLKAMSLQFSVKVGNHRVRIYRNTIFQGHIAVLDFQPTFNKFHKKGNSYVGLLLVEFNEKLSEAVKCPEKHFQCAGNGC